MRRLLLGLLLALLAGALPAAGSPTVWKVQGKHSTVYLFGSVHVLSPTVVWRDDKIEDLIHSADTFMFETALDQQAVTQLVESQGSLPPGESLRAMLPPVYQKDLDADLATIGIPEAGLDGRRPWLAGLGMAAIKMTKGGGQPTGPDIQLSQEALSRGKPIRYFETIEQQMALLVPTDKKLELEEFEAFLKDFQNETMDVQPMVDAWLKGDDDALEALLMKNLGKHPGARKAMFDDRNHRWVVTLKDILDNDSGTFFVTVGAGHLLGKTGVPALLHGAGYAPEKV
jgi:uncharacterized protein YbaP (TraB family)